MQNCEIWAVGRLTRDPERKFTQSGKGLLSFSMATEGEGDEKDTVWLTCTLWETNFKGERQHDLEHWQQELEQGAWVFVKGRPRARGYIAKDGTAKAVLEMTVTRLELPSPTHAPATEHAAEPATLDEIPF